MDPMKYEEAARRPENDPTLPGLRPAARSEYARRDERTYWDRLKKFAAQRGWRLAAPTTSMGCPAWVLSASHKCDVSCWRKTKDRLPLLCGGLWEHAVLLESEKGPVVLMQPYESGIHGIDLSDMGSMLKVRGLRLVFQGEAPYGNGTLAFAVECLWRCA